MTMTADPPRRLSVHGAQTAPANPAQRLRTTFAAARVSFTWFGVRKSLNVAQKAQAAEAFGAEGAFLSAGKKLLDTRAPAFRAVTAVRNRIQCYWRGLSLPYPEPGLRLVRQQDLEVLERQLQQFKAELAQAVDQLDGEYAALQAAARERLGTLFDPADYPLSLRGLFAVEWDYPSVEPPEYLRRLSPELYEQERQRIAGRFEEAVQLAEQAFLGELAQLVEHLTQRLTDGPEGRKVLRDSAVSNLHEFFERFRTLNIHSNAELDRLVETARQALAGVAPQDLRDQAGLRQQLARQFTAVQAALDGLLVEVPRRRLLRGEVR
jgi:hypothetical protein